MDFSTQIKSNLHELRNSAKKFKSRFETVLIRCSKKFYSKLKNEARSRNKPMTKVLDEKLSTCEWSNLTNYDIN